jgi:hypothetical protein
MNKNKNWKEVKTWDSIGKTNFFFGTLSFRPWAILAMWLHMGATKKYIKNEFTTHFERNFTIGYKLTLKGANESITNA